MEEHEFDVILRMPAGDPFGEDSRHVDALYMAGCDDATVSSDGEGHLRISFSREGDLSSAVAFAISEIAKAIPEATFERIEFLHS